MGIDPGATFNGFAALSSDGETVATGTMGPNEALDQLDIWLRRRQIRKVVYEEFVLYPWKADDQAFSNLTTAEQIGAIKWICRSHHVTCIPSKTAWKKPTFAIMEAKGIPLVGRNQHEKDAESHMWRDHLRLQSH